MGLVNGQDVLFPHFCGVEFDIHGIVGIRLIDPAPKDATGLMKQLGPYRASLEREPDITIRFQKELFPSGLKYLGLNSAGFTEEGFYVLGRSDGEVKARIPFRDIGGPCEIVCRSGLQAVPLLFDVIRLALLRKDYIPLHASAFVYNGIGILVVGWSKGGKTEALLSFANHGAHYVGDEWVILSQDGHRMFGLPVPVTMWEWQFEQIPDLLPEISVRKRMMFALVHCLDAVYRTFGRGNLQNLFPVDVLGKLLPIARQGLNVQALPQSLFQDRVCEQGASLDKIFLLVSHSKADITIEPRAAVEITQRIVHSNEYEQKDFFQTYAAFKFAFPGLRNEFLEQAPILQSSLLYNALGGKEAYEVLHPYPVSFDELFERMRGVL